MATIEIFESLRPSDHARHQRDGLCLVQPLRLFRLQPVYTHIGNRDEFCEHVTMLRGRRLLAWHVSSHGDDAGLQFADRSRMTWRQLARLIAKADLDIQVLALSSCNALATDELPTELENCNVRIPWLIGPASPNGVTFDDACTAYITFYRILANWRLENPRRKLNTSGNCKEAIRLALDAMHALPGANFRYYRWSQSNGKYLYNGRRHSYARLLQLYEELAA